MIVRESNTVPFLLERARVEEYRAQFLREYDPVGPTELAIVGDLARQCAAMERWGEGGASAGRQAARGLPALVGPAHGDDDAWQEAVLVGALSSETTERCERQYLGHARAFYRALQKLQELQARRKQGACEKAVAPSPFADEAACEAYLAARFREGRCPCSKCGGTQGYIMPARRAWECSRCKLQTGLRSGTVMARSAIPLWCWFEAIRLIYWQPTISVADLAAKVGARRLATMRSLASKVRQAMADNDASAKLAGLDVHFARAATAPEPGVQLPKTVRGD